MNVAYVFPGQGAQYVGMGQDFYNSSPRAKEVFDDANKILGFNLTKLIFEGPIEELTRTVNCQVAIFTASIAFLRALEGVSLSVNVRYTAGLSLGEYTALVLAGAFSFEEGLKLVRLRAQYMENAALLNPGGMVCLIGLSREIVEKICEETGVEVANLNCPDQIVISGRRDFLEKAKELAHSAGAKRVVPLNVSGAFHSSLLSQASQKLENTLKNIEVSPIGIPVVSNVTAKEEKTPDEIKANLAGQLVKRMLWEDSVRFISNRGINNFVEIGPGKVLKGLLRKINPELKVYNIEKVQDLETVCF